MIEWVSLIVSGFAQIGVDAAKKHLGDCIDVVRIKNLLNDYIKRNWNSYEQCDLNEEMDFQGLIDYLDQNLMVDIEDCFFGTTSKIRCDAQEKIINQAIAYARPSGDAGRKLITKYLSDILGILRNFFDQKLDKKTLYAIKTVEDDINQNNEEVTEEQTKELKQFIDQSCKKSLAEIQETIEDSQEFSLAKFEQYARKGDLNTIDENISKISDILSTAHPLFPDYGYRFLGDHTISFPLSEEATRKYPPNIHIEGSLYMGGSPVTNLYTEKGEYIAHYADRHQLELKIKVRGAQKRLGDLPDPNQSEAERLFGATLTRTPRPFPESEPFNILIDGKVWYEYVELRAQEILDDETYILSNAEQKNSRLQILLYANFDTDNFKFSFSFKSDNQRNDEYLEILKSIQYLYLGHDITLHNLNTGEDFLRFDLSDIGTYETGFDSLEEEIEFISNICDIENFFKTNICLPEEIGEEDYETVCFLSDLIHGKKKESHWNSFSIEVIMSEKIRDAFSSTSDQIYSGVSMDVSANASIDIFGNRYPLKVKRCFQSARICDIEKLTQKVQILDDGEIVRVTFGPGENDIAEDSLIFTDI